ncbi:MAG TPA: TonB-dependent receptor [Sphingomicrobium sp.]|nr:TonB-dependent receptor [Sphingomicrobium sp.]
MNMLRSSLLATTIIAGVGASPALAQTQPTSAAPAGEQSAMPPGASSEQKDSPSVKADATAVAAQPASSAQAIVITGTLIRNPNLVASAPVTVIGQNEIQLRQNNTAEEVLRTIPGAAASSNAQVNNGNVGASFVNLRSLGTNRNIVLLDGVRVVPFDQLLRVDLNIIPLALVERVDVLTGGASSTYGADAVAGVVNFVTRNDFSGIELQASDGITQRGDENYLRGDLTVGGNFDDHRGNAVLSIGYQQSDPVFQGNDRSWSTLALDSHNPGNLKLAGSSVTTPTRLDLNNASAAFPSGSVQVNGTNFVDYGSAGIPFNFNPYNVFQTPFQRYNMYSAGHYDIADHLTAYARGLFSQNSVKTIIAPSGDFATPADIPISNPFLSPAQRAVLCNDIGLTVAQCAAAAAATGPKDPNYAVDNVGVRRRTVEVGPRVSDYQTRTWDFRFGVRGDITDKIGFDVFGARGITNSVQQIQNYALNSRFQQGLLTQTDANGNTVCQDPSNGCTPINLFGPPGSITPEMANFLRGNSEVTTDVKLSQARATINGDTPLQLWAKNPVSFAVGTEYRKYSSDIIPDSLAQSGDLGGFGTAPPPVTGGLDVYEGFAEVIAPIVSDRPFFDELQVEGGIRRSHYTIFSASRPKFSTTTWKVAGSWAPVSDIKFRGAYNRAVRAPNISELFTPASSNLTNLSVDPCAGSAPVGNAALTATCVAQGAPANKIGTIANPNAGQANSIFAGNLNLKPETATTWTVGAVIRPSIIRGLSATVDYYNIQVSNAITTPTPLDAINACFSNPSPSNPACTVIHRNTKTGALDGDPTLVPGLFLPSSNLGKVTTDGVDLAIDYRTGLGMLFGTRSKLALTFGGNWTHSQKFQATPTSDNRECVGFYSANCGFPAGQLLPKYTANTRATLSFGRIDLSVLWRYVGQMAYEGTASDFLARGFTAGNRFLFKGLVTSGPSTSPFVNGAGTLNGQTVDFNHIPAFNYFDFATRFNVNGHLDLTFTVTNLLDKKPPIVGNTAGSTAANSGDTFPALYDPLGRRFTVGARIKF